MKNQGKVYHTALFVLFHFAYLTNAGADSLVAKVSFYPNRESGQEADVNDVLVGIEGRIVPLKKMRGDPSTFYETKAVILDELGLPLNKIQNLKVMVQHGASSRILRMNPGDQVGINGFDGNVTVFINFFDPQTYYTILIPEAKQCLSKALTLSGDEREAAFNQFFETMHQAAEIAGKKDSAFLNLYTSGLSKLLTGFSFSDSARERVTEWFQWACLERIENSPSQARTDLSKFIDSAARSTSPEVRSWIFNEIVIRSYELGISPIYGHDTLCDKLIETDREFNLGFQLATKELERLITNPSIGLDVLKAWFGRGTSSLRGMSDRQTSLGKLRAIVATREALGLDEKSFLNALKHDLNVIESGG